MKIAQICSTISHAYTNHILDYNTVISSLVLNGRYQQHCLLMRKNLVDFSNVYSPRSQSLLAKGRNILTQLNTTKLSPRSPNTPKTPKTPPLKSQFVTNIPEKETYSHNNRVILTKERVQQIHDRLAIDSQTERGIEMRMKTGQMYFKDNDNPFTREFQLQVEKKPQQESQKKSTQRSILGEMGRLRGSNRLISPKRIEKIPTPVKDIWVKLKKKREKKQHFQFPSYYQQKKSGHQQAAMQWQTKSAFEEFDELVERRQVNFFQHRYETTDKNIFLLIKDKNHPQFRSNKEILDLLHFNHDSMVTMSTQKQMYRLNCLDEISSFSRLLIKGLKLKNMPEKMMVGAGDLNLKMDRLQLEDMMLICSGKLSSPILLRYFREEEEESSKKKANDGQQPKEQKQQIIYSQRTRNKLTNFNPVNQVKAQIEYYGKSQYTKLEYQQQIISKTVQNKLKRLIQEEIESLSCTIRDKQVMERFQKLKNKTLLQLLTTNADRRIDQLMKEVERKIRMNKINKNRTEKVKVDILTQSLKMKKTMEGVTNSKSKSRDSGDSSFSPLKTWRN